MIKYHTERNIKFAELLQIFLKKQDIFTSLEKMYPAKSITLTNYGRTAFEMILDKYDIKNCRVMIPAFICSFFYDLFKKRNITPVLIDIEMDTFNISPRTLKKGFDRSAKALITNNMNGLPCEVEKLKKILTKNQLLIEDCAHSLGAKHKNQYVGLTGDASFFSLYKNLPCIAGGFALTNESLPDLEENMSPPLLKLIYFTGKNANFYKGLKKDDHMYEDELIYENVGLKKPSKMVERLAAFYVKKLDEIISTRKKIAKDIMRRLANRNLTFQSDPNNEHIYTYFSFLLPKEIAKKRIKFLEELRKQGVIGRIVWNKPLNNYVPNSNCVNTKEVSERIFGLPLNPNYSEKDVAVLCEKVSLALDKIY
jgi:dTDP-4-amino-4,6-dideoxygalactose transaminase